MRQPTRAEIRTAHPRMRRLTASVLVLLVVMLPVLLAFVRIDAAPRPAEIERVGRALFAETELTQPLRLFYRSFVPDGSTAPGRWPADQQTITATARVAGMLALFGISGLVYLLLLFVRGRATAAVGCVALCCVPSFALEGFVLRPEQCATVFGLLGVVLIAGLPLMLQSRRRGAAPWLAKLCLMFVVGSTFGVAFSCHPGAGIYLTVPAAALLLSVMAVLLMFPRATRKKSIMEWPLRAAARRYVPWMFLVLVSFTVTLMVRQQAGGAELVDSSSAVGLLPANPWLAAPVLLVAGAGAARMLVGVGLRLNRLRRVRPDGVLFLYVAAMLMQWGLGEGGRDSLPAAPALACLIGDGAISLAVVGVGRLNRARARRG